MAVDNYADLLVAIASWLQRQDLSASIPDFVTLAEAEFNRALRDTRMIATVTQPTTANARSIPVPSDFLQVSLITAVGGSRPLEPLELADLRRLRMTRLTLPGAPLYYAINGRALELCPTPATAGSLELEYFQAIPPLASSTSGTNWLLAYAPDLYLQTAVKHGRLFLQDYDAAKAFGDGAESGDARLDAQAADAAAPGGG